MKFRNKQTKKKYEFCSPVWTGLFDNDDVKTAKKTGHV